MFSGSRQKPSAAGIRRRYMPEDPPQPVPAVRKSSQRHGGMKTLSEASGTAAGIAPFGRRCQSNHEKPCESSRSHVKSDGSLPGTSEHPSDASFLNRTFDCAGQPSLKRTAKSGARTRKYRGDAENIQVFSIPSDMPVGIPAYLMHSCPSPLFFQRPMHSPTGQMSKGRKNRKTSFYTPGFCYLQIDFA